MRQMGVTDSQFMGPPVNELCQRLQQAGRIALLKVLALGCSEGAINRPSGDRQRTEEFDDSDRP